MDLGGRYDSSVDAYDTLYGDLSRRKYMVLLDMLGDGEVLDIGIGTGQICGFIAGRYGVGVDISFKSLHKAAERCESMDLVLGDVREGFLRRGFDIGLAVSTCHHLGLECIELLDRYTSRWAAGYIYKFLGQEELERLSRRGGYKLLRLWDENFLVKR